MQLKPDSARNIDELIRLFNRHPVLTSAQREAMYRAFSKAAMDNVIDEGASYQEAFQTPAHLQQDYNSFKETLTSTDNDLDWQCDVVTTAFKHYQKTGEVLAPYYPMRIAIILRKMKEKDREQQFLAAWCRHFPRGNGVKYEKLVERAIKLGAITKRPAPLKESTRRHSPGEIVFLRNDENKDLVVRIDFGDGGTIEFPVYKGDLFKFTTGTVSVGMTFSDKTLDIPRGTKPFSVTS